METHLLGCAEQESAVKNNFWQLSVFKKAVNIYKIWFLKILPLIHVGKNDFRLFTHFWSNVTLNFVSWHLSKKLSSSKNLFIYSNKMRFSINFTLIHTRLGTLNSLYIFNNTSLNSKLHFRSWHLSKQLSTSSFLKRNSSPKKSSNIKSIFLYMFSRWKFF